MEIVGRLFTELQRTPKDTTTYTVRRHAKANRIQDQTTRRTRVGKLQQPVFIVRKNLQQNKKKRKKELHAAGHAEAKWCGIDRGKDWN